MPEGEHRVLDERRALELLDAHYGVLMRCPVGDLRRPGWSFAPPPDEHDPMSLLFGQRVLVSLLAPVAASDAAGRAGVAACAPELRRAVGALLSEWSPESLFTPYGLAALAAVASAAHPLATVENAAAPTRLRYVIPAEFRPYLGRWLDWLEPLDESAEVDPTALSLLARFSGGVFVVRSEGAIYAFSGLRSTSAHVSEIFSLATAPRDAAPTDAHELARAVTSRATRAALAVGHIPLYAAAVGHRSVDRMLDALGYRVYADTMTVTAPTGA